MLDLIPQDYATPESACEECGMRTDDLINYLCCDCEAKIYQEEYEENIKKEGAS
jgi:DNA-directed RNA polymerase subunit RPC12/RpoP